MANQDKKAIFARRDAFIKKMLSNEEQKAVTGGDNTDIPKEPCLSVCFCYTPSCYTPCYVIPAP